jgi:hypothetical protein
MNRCLTTATMFTMALFAVSTAMADFIVNGGFENVTNGKVDDWAYGGTAGGVIATTPSVISGTNSVEMVTDGYLARCPTGAPAHWLFETDFAAFAGTDRSFNVLLDYDTTNTHRINLSVGANGQLQVHSTNAASAGWQNVGTLTAALTADASGTGVWARRLRRSTIWRSRDSLTRPRRTTTSR